MLHSAAFWTSSRPAAHFPTRHGQVTQRLEILGIYRPDRKSNPPSEPDLQRIQRLNAAGIMVSVLTYNPDVAILIPVFSTDYYNDLV
jgi:hypothetical protein